MQGASQLRYLASRLIVLAAIAPLLITTTCDRSDPHAAFEHARQTFIHGNLVQCQQEAERGYRRFARVSPEWGWKFKILQAQSLLWRAQYHDVLDLLESANRDSTPIDSTVAILTFRGLAHGRLLDLASADKELKEATLLCKQSSTASCGEAFQGYGVFALGRGEFAEAEQSFEEALAIARIRDDHFLEANILLNWTALLLKENRFDESIDRSDAAFKTAESIAAADLALAAQQNLAWAYYRLGEPERSLELFVDAEKRAAKLGDNYGQENALTDIGYIEMDAHRFEDAKSSLQRALSLAQSEQNEEHIYNVLRVLARFEMINGKLADASDFAAKARDVARRGHNPLDELYPDLVEGQIAAARGETADAEQKLRFVEQYPGAPTFLKWESQHSMARLYEKQAQPDQADAEYRAAVATLEAARDEVQHTDFQVSFLSKGSRIYDDYVHFLVTHGKADDALRRADYGRGRALAEGLGLFSKAKSHEPPPLDAKKIAERTKSTILYYWLGEQSSYFWAITSKRIQLFQIPPATEIESLVERYNKSLGSPQGFHDTASPEGVALYRMLIEPAKELVAANKKVVIIPDGKLSSLNFETLLVPEPAPHYWIEDVTVVNAGSLNVLAVPRSAKTQTTRNLLLFGSAISPGKEYADLANAATEMASIERHFPTDQQQVFQGANATVEAYLSGHPEQFSFIHFVTHATAARSTPLDSAIILSADNAKLDSFKLYARDIIQHPIHADLVTISSCYSAGARSYSGEGLVGLSWAFLRAGAHNVVAALWDASDLSTGQLMDKFYDGLSNGNDPETALRLAKLSLLHSKDSFRKPFYWGPFQLYVGS